MFKSQRDFPNLDFIFCAFPFHMTTDLFQNSGIGYQISFVHLYAKESF